MHADLFRDTVRRSRQEEHKLRTHVRKLLASTKTATDPATAAAFLGAAHDRERRANEFKALAAEFEHKLLLAGESTDQSSNSVFLR